MIKFILYCCFCYSFLLTFICFTKYFPMSAALVPTAFVVHVAFHLTEAAKHIIFKFPSLQWSSYKTPKQKRAATQQENIWARLSLFSRNAELLKLNTQATTVLFFSWNALGRSQLTSCIQSSWPQTTHILPAWCMCLWVLSFQWTGSFLGAETVFLVTHHFVQH